MRPDTAVLPPRFLRTKEAAEFLSLSARTLEKHRRLLVCADARAGELVGQRLRGLPGADKVFDFGSMSYGDPAAAQKIALLAARHSDFPWPSLEVH